MPLARSQPARPEPPRPQPELAGGSRPGTQSSPAGLRASPAPVSPALPQQAPQPVAWAGAAAGSCALPGTDAGPPRHVRPSPRPAGAAPFPWFKVRAERSRGAGAQDAKDAGREAPTGTHLGWNTPCSSLEPGPCPLQRPRHTTCPISICPGSAPPPPGRWLWTVNGDPGGQRGPEGGGGPTVPRDAWALSWPGHEGNRGEKVSKRSRAPFFLLPGTKTFHLLRLCLLPDTCRASDLRVIIHAIHPTPVRKGHWPYLTYGKTEAQGNLVPCPRSHSQ